MYFAKSIVVAALVAFTLWFAFTRLRRIALLIRAGRDEPLFDRPLRRLQNVGIMVFGHKKVLEDPWSGLLHVFFLYGFFTLGIGHTELVLNGLTAFLVEFGQRPLAFDMFLPTPLLHGYHLSQDLMAAAVVVVSAIALLRRWSGKVKRLMPRSMDAEIILWFIFALYVTFFLYEGSKHALAMQSGSLSQGFHAWIPFSSVCAQVLLQVPAGPLAVLNEVSYFAHVAVFLGFGCYVPMSKHMHLVFAGPNVYFERFDAAMGLPPAIDFADETVEKYGVDRVFEYSWKTLLDTFACTECGRCNSVCPAHTTGKPLQPKKVLHDLKVNLREHNADAILTLRDGFGRPVPDFKERHASIELKTPLIAREPVDRNDPTQVSPLGTYLKVDGQVHLDELWACTTCGACVEACPVLIDSVPGSLIGLRQTMVMMEADFPEELTAALKGLENQGNPWGVGQDKREDWLTDLDATTMAQAQSEGREVEYLFWVGCAGATDDRAKKTQKAMVKILKSAGVDYGILGCEEKCTGDPARRMGNEYLFDSLAQENAEVLKQHKFKKIFTACPHCFNSLQNEYPKYGADYTVQHHTQLLAELVRDGRLKLDDKAAAESVTFHDPCYLGRYNDQVAEPRLVLEALPGVTTEEMDRHGKQSFCCGAGGGRMWMEEHVGKRVNVERTEEALVALNRRGQSAAKKTIAVGCPFCMTMITDGTKAKEVEESVAVKDVAELVAERLVV